MIYFDETVNNVDVEKIFEEINNWKDELSNDYEDQLIRRVLDQVTEIIQDNILED